MFRRNFTRLGHQLIKEPMGHEENTFCRGQRSRSHALNHVYGLAGFCAVGCVAALYSFASHQCRVYTAVAADGKMIKSTCPTKWWNF